jgi:hypothetical protein
LDRLRRSSPQQAATIAASQEAEQRQSNLAGAKTWGEYAKYAGLPGTQQAITQAQNVGLAPGVTQEGLQSQDNPLSRFAKQYGSIGGGMSTATEAMEGKQPSFGGYARDFFGVDNPGGFLGSRAGSVVGFGLSAINPLAGLAYKAAQYSQDVGPIAQAERYLGGTGTEGTPSDGQTYAPRTARQDGGRERTSSYLRPQQQGIQPLAQNYLGAPIGNTWAEWGAARRSAYG